MLKTLKCTMSNVKPTVETYVQIQKPETSLTKKKDKKRLSKSKDGKVKKSPAQM